MTIYEQLDDLGLLEYGSVIDGDLVRGMAGISCPEVGTRQDFEAAQLEELAIVDAIRKELLKQGKYLKADRSNYRILTPSENAAQVESYMRSADAKLKRAITLSKNTPKDAGQGQCNSMARALVKRESISKRLSRIC